MFFFFQAEDGIRDDLVTGVQTCALPIYCKFNNAYKVNKGTYNGVSLAGAKFWVAGDLGSNFGDGEADWAVLTFDPSVTPAQREGIGAILGHVYPVKWTKFDMGTDAPIV